MASGIMKQLPPTDESIAFCKQASETIASVRQVSEAPLTRQARGHVSYSAPARSSDSRTMALSMKGPNVL